jgi:hypothetical protein
MSKHEKDVFTIGARVLAVICMMVAIWISYQLFDAK